MTVEVLAVEEIWYKLRRTLGFQDPEKAKQVHSRGVRRGHTCTMMTDIIALEALENTRVDPEIGACLS